MDSRLGFKKNLKSIFTHSGIQIEAYILEEHFHLPMYTCNLFYTNLQLFKKLKKKCCFKKGKFIT